MEEPRARRRVPRWLILDRFVHVSHSSKLRGVVPRDSTASALAHDCAGRPVRASLRIADPPAVSRLYLQQTASRPPISDFQDDSQVIAAHRSAILFRLTVPFKDGRWLHHTVCFPDDYFVYSSSCRRTSPSPPSLTRLPACFHGGSTTCPERDKRYQPYRRQQQRSMLDEDIGILSHDHGDGEQGEPLFTVAQLSFSGPDEFELCVYASSSSSSSAAAATSTTTTTTGWSVHKLQKPLNMTSSAYSWRTDVVVPIQGDDTTTMCCLCWVDYYQGLLLVDVVTMCRRNADDDDDDQQQQQQWIRYIPLPSKAMSTRPYRDGGVADPLRCVSVTDAGVVKLVCILITDQDYHPLSACPFVIQTWTLGRQDTLWTLDDSVTMDAVGFFRVLGAADTCLPRSQGFLWLAWMIQMFSASCCMTCPVVLTG